jgi:hypothetical protein
MASFEDIQKKEFEALTAEICTLGRRLVELGWSRDQVLAYVTQLLTDPKTPRLEFPTRATRRADHDSASRRKNDHWGAASLGSASP